MNPAVHVVSRNALRELARGGGCGAVTQLKRAEMSKLNLMLRSIVSVAGDTGHPQASMAHDGYWLLARLQRDHPSSVAAVLRTPAVHAWAQITATALSRGDSRAADAGRLATIALAAAIRSHGTCEIDIPGPDGTDRSVNLPALGRAVGLPLAGVRIRAVVDRGCVMLSDERAAATLPRRLDTDAPGWLASRTFSATHGGMNLNVRIDDLDAYRFPGGARPAARLDAEDANWWQSQLVAAWRILVEHHNAAAGQIAAAVTTLCPLVSGTVTGMSAATRIAPGCIGLSRPADSLSLALTLVHEVQHVKLAALMDLVPLVEDQALQSVHYAPWRDDARPLIGLLQGVYAHMAITDFWRVQRHVAVDRATALRAQFQFARWRKAASDTAAYLSAVPGLTRYGRMFVDDMRGYMRRWNRERVSEQALEMAFRQAAAHRARWETGQDEVDQGSMSLRHGQPSRSMVR